MSSATRRNKNRATARWLEHHRHTCPECGERGKHWVEAPEYSFAFFPGFWTCAKFYGADGRRVAA